MTTALHKVRIFIVEDEAIVALDIEQQLISLGYEPVGRTGRGESAISLVGELKPDLVLMDIRLTGAMDGIEVAQVIRAQYEIPIIFITAYASSDIVEQSELVESFSIISKPFNDDELRSAIELVLYKPKSSPDDKWTSQGLLDT